MKAQTAGAPLISTIVAGSSSKVKENKNESKQEFKSYDGNMKYEMHNLILKKILRESTSTAEAPLVSTIVVGSSSKVKENKNESRQEFKS